MINMPKLSIITVNLNNKEGLQRTVDSVISQTFSDFEWIIIDGGSNDGSTKIIEQYQKKLSFYCSEPDNGIYNAMNKGIKYAKGEWLLFLNSGDRLYDKSTLSSVVFPNNNIDIIYGIMHRSSENGCINNENMMKSKLHWSDFLSNSLPHQATFIRRTLFDKIGLYDESLKAVSDWKFFIKAIVYNKTQYRFIQQDIAIYEGQGISDFIGHQERNMLIPQLFPAMMIDDLPKIRTYDYLCSNKNTKFIVNLLLKYIHWNKKRTRKYV